MTDDKLLALAKLAVELYEGLPSTDEGNEAAQMLNDAILQMETGQTTIRQLTFRGMPVVQGDVPQSFPVFGKPRRMIHG